MLKKYLLILYSFTRGCFMFSCRFIVLPFVILALSYSVSAWSQVSAPEARTVTAGEESALTFSAI